jgi:bifunctional DNA-binding transcriptional regulator/antitoxin component of YhaV-PrlF toxin-antitoxin module
MPTAVKIKSFRINKRRAYQMQMTIPRTWLEENGLKEGDFIDLLKDVTGRLIIVPGNRAEQEPARE